MPWPLRILLATPPPPDGLVAVTWRGWALCAGVFLTGALAMASVQFSQVHLVGADAYHHVGMAREIAKQGLPDRFPWTQASVFRDHYADKQLLFHLLLIPFLGEGLTLGPKLLTVLLGALLLALLAWFLLRHDISWPVLWICLVMAAGVMFLYRMSLTRPHLLAVPLAVLATHFMLRRHVAGTFLVALVFPLCYTAAHLLFGLVMLYALACALKREPFPWRLVLAVVVGTGLGLLLHPHGGNILRLWFWQNVKVVHNVWSLPGEVPMGSEFYSVSGRVFLWDTWLVLLSVFALLMGFLVRGGQARLRTIFLFVASGAFLFLFLNIPRFIEYWVPFSVLFAAAASQDLLADGIARDWLGRHRMAGPVLCALGLLLLLGQTTRSVVESQIEVERDRSLHYRNEASWISRHVPPAEVVFTCSWDSFPYLFFFAPEQRYLVALDPTFMQALDPGLYELWTRISTGQEPRAADRILSGFGARWVFVERRSWTRRLLERAARDRRFLLVHNGPEAAVYTLLADPLPVAEWLTAAGLARVGALPLLPAQQAP